MSSKKLFCGIIRSRNELDEPPRDVPDCAIEGSGAHFPGADGENAADALGKLGVGEIELHKGFAP